MALAQHLVDQRLILYDGGSWTLPEQLARDDLPASADEAFHAQAAKLHPMARRLAEAQALALHDAFTREEYGLLEPDSDPSSVDEAITELVTQQIVASDGLVYTLAHRATAAILCASLDDAQRRQRHKALAELHQRTGAPVLATVRHLLLAGEHQRGLDHLAQILTVKNHAEIVSGAQMSPADAARTLEHALQGARLLRRPRREIIELQRWIALLSVANDDAMYWLAAPNWLEQLKLDSGLDDWHELHAVSDPGKRLTQALQRAALRHVSTSENERVYPPDEAIRLLAQYVVISIAVGARTLDARLLETLPVLIEPFVPLSPILDAIWQNALATRESSCHRQSERARERWIEVYERLGRVLDVDPQSVNLVRHAVAFGVGLCEASMGLESALHWAEILDRDPLQKVTGMYLRKVMCLQQGDLDGAERFRKQAELLAIQSSSRQMFTNLLTLEIGVHAAAWDLTGVRQIAARIEPLAERHRGWLPFRHLAEAHFQRLRGDLEAACQAYERCLALCTPDPQDPTRSIMAWPSATASYVETLVSLGRAEEAKSIAEGALRICKQRCIVASSHDICRALALAEGKLSDHPAAIARLDALIEQQTELGVAGLNLGATYEARARIAIWATDRPAVERYGRLAAEQYRHGRGSPLGARYERLMDEARGAGMLVLPPLSAFESTMFGTTELGTRGMAVSAIVDAMHGADSMKTRAQRALQLLCEARGASAGHLYLAAEAGLELVASSAIAAPDEALRQFVTQFWTQQIADGDLDTAMSDGHGQSAPSALLWSDLHGIAYEPLLMSSLVGGVMLHAGVAMLMRSAQRTKAVNGTQLAAALGAFLIRSGDTLGVPYGA
jgi:tetratricopeptide (TPR) repeat protein